MALNKTQKIYGAVLLVALQLLRKRLMHQYPCRAED